jgi:hypothetical protein
MDLDEQMIHASKCKTGGDLTRRHHIIRNVLFKQLQDARYVPELEKNNLCAGQERPADVYVPVYENLKPAAIDVAIITPIQDKYMREAMETSLFAAHQYEQFKVETYQEKLNFTQVHFYPFVLEVLDKQHKQS